MPTRAVVARETELDRLRGFLAGAESQSLVLRGAPGIGKTLLWQTAVDEAVERRERVLVHRAVEAEAALAFTGLADLLMLVLADVGDALPAPRLRALRVALLLEEPGDEPPQPQAVGLALLDVLTALCAESDVLVAIDDLQWLDSSTAAALPLALRRLAGERLKVLATLREAPGVRAPFELARLFGDERAGEIRLSALDISALHRLLADRLELELPRPELMRIHELSGGNPLFALELGREVAQSGGLHVPASLREALDARLARLPERAAPVLLAAAALARPTIDAVAQGPEAQAALEDSIAAGVVGLDGEIVRFTHPLLASRCYERASPWARRAMHRALAEQVDDVEQQARHLALAANQPHESVAAQLDEAVAAAAARGATAAAAELAELAVGLTPGDPSPRKFAAAHFHHLAGDFARASELYAQLAEALPPGLDRADALYLRALIGLDDLPGRVRLCEQALAEAQDDDVRCAQIHGFQAISRWVLGDLQSALAEARVGVERAERTGNPQTIAVALGRAGFIESCALEITPGLLERGVALEADLSAPLFFLESPAFFYAVVLFAIEQHDRSREMLTEFLAASVRNGDEHARLWTLLQLVLVEWYAGRLSLAREHAVAAREIAAQTGEPQFLGMLEPAAALVEADSGLLDEARAAARRGHEVADRVGDEVFRISSQAALGHAELVAGDLQAAIEVLRPLPGRQLRAGHRSMTCDPWVDTIEVLIGLGELGVAQDQLARYRELPSIEYRWAQVGAARAEGLLRAARGEKDAALAALEEALSADDPPIYPLQRGRTLLALGIVQRRAQQRRAARETLEEAAALFDSLGAKPWAAKARAELGRISGRGAAGSDELTKAERQVAELAAEGRKNKEIAAAMFVTVGTVETHLSRVYRKLGVRSRSELAGRFTRDGAAKVGDRTAQT